ncbi:LamG domain-containing protein [Rosistilla oblonga]|uniref:LamG domain-containing protein n=1 Tax=Rosistilla oblonga TaxID=2527990 RepID=UPI003A9863D8
MSEPTHESEVPRAFRLLVQKLVDDTLTPEESRQLAEEMQESEPAREYYLRYIQIHSELTQRWGGVNLPQLPSCDLGSQGIASACERPNPLKRIFSASRSTVAGNPAKSQRRRAYWGVAWAAALCLAVGVFWMVANRPGEDVPGATMIASNEPPAETTVAPSTPPSDEVYVEQAAAASLAKVAAVIVNVRNVRQPGLTVGRRLRPGMLSINQGTVQLEFMSGAVLALSGPAQLQIESKDFAMLVSGAIRANVPERARGFVLNAPDTAVVDLGTEFTMRVDNGETSEVDVVEGEVELSLLADDGTTLVSQRLKQGSHVRVDRDTNSLLPFDSPVASNTPTADASDSVNASTIVPPMLLADDRGLNVSRRYVDMVKRQQPIIYWRFEQADNNIVKNELHDQWAAEIVGSTAENQLISIRNGYARFRRGGTSRYLVSRDPIEGINRGSYTIECWIKPDDLQHATCFGLTPISDPGGHQYLNVFEILTDTFLIHEPGAFRFLHRSPPAENYGKGTNLISPGICVPEVWQHLVMTKGDRQLEMYCNGQLIKQVAIEDANHPTVLQLLVGQLGFDGWRQYAGGMDELAIYAQQLSAEEIQMHYQTMYSENTDLFAPVSF